MAATFNPALTTPRDKARAELGDTDVTDALFPDETYDAMLAETGAFPVSVAAILARRQQAIYARKVDTVLDDQQIKYSQLAKNFGDLATSLERRARAYIVANPPATPPPTTGGIFVFGHTAAGVIRARTDPTLSRNVDRLLPDADW